MTTRNELVTGNYTYLEVTAEAYHSGSTASVGLIVPNSFYKEYEEDIDDWHFSFHELNGKHSEVEGELTATDIREHNVDAVVRWLLDVSHGQEKLLEMVQEIDSDLLEEIDCLNSNLQANVSLQTIVVWDGE